MVTRLVAAAIDAVVVCLALAGGYVVLVGVRLMFSPRSFTFPDPSAVFTLVAAFGVLVAYLTVAWWISGRSYGCLVMGLRVVDHRGSRMRLPTALLRAVSCAVFPVGLLWVAFSRENRSLQDAVLRTSVVYDWQPRREPRARA